MPTAENQVALRREGISTTAMTEKLFFHVQELVKQEKVITK